MKAISVDEDKRNSLRRVLFRGKQVDPNGFIKKPGVYST